MLFYRFISILVKQEKEKRCVLIEILYNKGVCSGNLVKCRSCAATVTCYFQGARIPETDDSAFFKAYLTGLRAQERDTALTISPPHSIMPKTFADFTSLASNTDSPYMTSLSGQTFGKTPPWITQQEGEKVFQSEGVISLKRAGTLFALGVAGAYGGSAIYKKMFKEVGKGVALKNLKGFEKTVHNESQTYLNIQNPLLALYTMAVEKPEFKKVFGTYIGASILGYLSSSLMQGAQEAWVRREEMGIRAKLIARMNGTFQQSIRIKQNMDDVLHTRARQQIQILLQQHQIAHIERLMDETLQVESPEINRHYFYEPTHRTSSSLHFGGDARSFGEPFKDSSPDFIKALDVFFVGVGVSVGLLLQGFGKVVKTLGGALRTSVNKDQMIKSVSLYDSEALLALLNSKMTVLSYGLLVGVAAAGKLVVDGLREIEVTQVHSATEYRYQKHNWEVLDPGFHRISEEEALNYALKQLARDLSRLKRNPKKLRERIQAILTNIGRNSAPNYFPMTPPVGLVVARS